MIGRIFNWARSSARATLKQLAAIGAYFGQGGYDAGKLNRHTKGRNGGAVSENLQPRSDIDRTRRTSWNLFRNSPYVKKACRSIQSKVIGNGMVPSPQATKADGSPHADFSREVQELWEAWSAECDYRGKPGRGGQSMAGLQATALNCCILSGDVLSWVGRLTDREQEKRGMSLPLEVQLIAPERLADMIVGDNRTNIIGGVEFDSRGRRTHYHIGPPEGSLDTTINRVSADQIVHTFIGEGIDQVRGVPWMAPAVFSVRDVGDLQQNELTASALASCGAIVVKRSNGNSRRLTAPAANDDGDAEEETLRPGMIFYTGPEGGIEGFNPNRPGSVVENFASHILHKVAVALPGVKGSTLTGDYRRSSFASERAADNDTWPETEALQKWFGESFCQPLYEEFITAAIESGAITSVTPAEFLARKANYLRCAWQGPVQRSINPVDDINAAALRMQKGLSSPQLEAAKLGVSVKDLLRQIAEFRQMVVESGLPPEYADQVLGDTTPGAAGGMAGQQQDPQQNSDPNADQSEGGSDGESLKIAA